MTDMVFKKITIVVVSAIVCLGLCGNNLAQAADCKALAEAIGKERTLLTRKSMIEDAMKACPRDAGIVYQHGYTLERLRKYEDALKSYKKAINLDSGYAKAFFSIGDIQMILKNYQEAAEAFETGLQIDPGDARALASLKDAQAKYKELTGKTLAPTVVAAAKPEVKAASPVVTVPAAISTEKSKTAVVAKVEDKTPPEIVAPILRLQVPFMNQTADLSQEAKDVLAVVVGQAMQRKDMSDSRFEVSGHTDNLGDPGKNMEISKQRAETVKKYLTENFNIADERLQVAYHGQNRPRVPNTSPANQEINRRVEFSKLQ